MIALLALFWCTPAADAAAPAQVSLLAEDPLSGSLRLGLARTLLTRPGWEEAGIESLVRLLDDPEAGTAARDALVELLGRVDARPGWEAIYARLLEEALQPPKA